MDLKNYSKDAAGNPFIIQLPSKVKRAVLNDFITIDLSLPEKYSVKLNMTYYVQSSDGKRYYVRTVHEGLQDIDLIPLIDCGQVFI